MMKSNVLLPAYTNANMAQNMAKPRTFNLNMLMMLDVQK